ncbi:MAG: hypothetical protein D6719_13235 [Candidatus Dadabacteria bacterium]|nr:MAG: hypothetical protein D6719_13235 [Candidatus Dadabacteria bacterium]
MKKPFLFVLLLLFCLNALSACQSRQDSSDNASEKALTEELAKILKEAKKVAGQVSPFNPDVQEKAQKEFEKLFVFEYSVKRFPADIEDHRLEHELNSVGKQRWECFDVERDKDQLVFYCKRRPKTYLRYLPKLM